MRIYDARTRVGVFHELVSMGWRDDFSETTVDYDGELKVIELGNFG